MSEFYVLGHSAAEILLFNAMSEIAYKDDILEVFGLEAKSYETKASVTVLVNGVKVDFEKHFKEGIQRLLDGHEENVRKSARLLITEKSQAISYLLDELENYHAGLEKCLDKLDNE